jgi:hypothetical protein
MIRLFLSSDCSSRMAAVIRATLGEMWSHGGLHDTERNETFEHRYRCGCYPWTDYTRNPQMRLAEFEILCASASSINAAYYLTKRKWEGRRYNAGQAVTMGLAALWARVGVERKIPLSAAGVCTEVVYDFLRTLGGKHALALNRWEPSPEGFTPGEAFDFFDWGQQYLFRRVA